MKTLQLTLNQNGGVDHGVIRIQDPSYSVRIVIPVGTEFHSPKTIVITDHPDSSNKPQTLTSQRTYSILEDDTFELKLTCAGAFTLHLSNPETKKEGPIVRFIVDPIIVINNKPIPSSALAIQTNLGRCIGHVQDWVEKLRPIAALGYNMIHLPPFQELAAESHYAISNQLEISSQLFPAKFPVAKRWPTFTETLKRIEKELGIVFMVDIVLNHSSPSAQFLHDHPECGFNLENSPHLRPAYAVDEALLELSNKIANNKVPEIPPDMKPEQVPALKLYLTKGLRDSRLPSFFVIDVDNEVGRLEKATEVQLSKQLEMLRMRAVNYNAPQRLNVLRTRGVITNIDRVTIDLNYAIALYRPPGSQITEAALEEYRLALATINAPNFQRVESIIKEVVDNTINQFQYNRYDPNGPKLGPITLTTPVCWNYFSTFKATDGRTVHLANNGWVYGDPTADFISAPSEAYLRRQVVIWGDNVKLRYGNKPEDCPPLWEYMTKYVRSVANVVHAVRLDNAHSTPLPVAEYFIKEVRKINPNIYVMAELFTGSEDQDIHYINHIGINSFLREGLHRTEPGKLTHLLWQSGGRPVAAIDSIDSESVLRPGRQIPGVIFDLTHDNALPAFDRPTISTAWSMSCSPIASTRGYDDYYPNPCDVVHDFDLYSVSKTPHGFEAIRAIINKLHVEMAVAGMNEIMAHYFGNVISIFRCNSQTGEGVWTVLRIPGESTVDQIAAPSPIDSLVFEGRMLSVNISTRKNTPAVCNMFLNTDMTKLRSVQTLQNGDLKLVDFPEGSVVTFRTKLSPALRSVLNSLEVDTLAHEFSQRVKALSLIDLSVLMFRCGAEENATRQKGTFSFPEYGDCFYAGTQGIETAFESAAKGQGMGSPVFSNVREGDWMIEFMCSRLYQNPRLIPMEGFLRKSCDRLKALPRYLVPKFLDRLIRSLNIACRRRAIELMTDFVKDGDELLQALSIASLEFYGPMRDAQLVHPSLHPIFGQAIKRLDSCMSAGLPHFASGYMRSWGRDTFIALRGIFMVTGRFDAALDHLIAFGSCLRHGLIPNLHDSCLNPRYNARDATWWFLQALQDFAFMTSKGGDVFKIQLPRLFPTDDQSEHERKYARRQQRPVWTFGELVQHILEKHANGIHFVEWNAGRQIDDRMKENGFHVDIVTDWSNGFVLGGNVDNCGTWMDKMGSSIKAKNSGVPASPRDGAAVEIIGLLQSTLRWLDSCSAEGSYPYKGVKVETTGKTITWSQWSNLLISSFESWFYVPLKEKHDNLYFIESQHINVRGIYKDTVGSTSEFSDYQFRPNLLVAMTVAPELFDPIHALKCLGLVQERLLGKIGMKTLDPSDFRYRPYYHNDDDNEDFLTSCGFNYHNGPEWVWPVGYFFRASMRFRREINDGMRQTLANIKRSLHDSFACGLPELTQKDGEFCPGSCATQAWSVATVLDVLYDYMQYTQLENDEDEFFDLEEEDE